MIPHRTRLLVGLIAGTGLWPAATEALTIVRWGDPTGSVSDSRDVRLISYAWRDIDALRDGSSDQVELVAGSIGPRRMDPDFNFGPEMLARGGVLYEQRYGPLFDGSLQTVWNATEYECGNHHTYNCDEIYGRQGTVDLDLGALFLLDRVRLVSGLDDPAHVVRDFRIHVATEVPRVTLTGQTQAFRPVAAEVRDNRLQHLDVFLPIAQRVRFVQLAVGRHDQPWTVPEIEIFARGFMERATWVGDVVDFGEPMVSGLLSWRGTRAEGSGVSIQTRTGHTPDPNIYWRFTGRVGDKAPVTREQYAQLAVGERAGTSHDRANWTFFSAPYDFADSAGTPVVSPSPRRYFQLKLDFRPNGEPAQIHSVELQASPPLATDLLGEVHPAQAAAGALTSFTYSILPTFEIDDPGFDQFELLTPSLLESVDSVRVGDQPVPFTVDLLAPHRALIAFPRVGPGDSGAIVEIVFRARVLQFGAGFQGRIVDSSQLDEVPQRVNPGDANARVEGRGVDVSTDVSSQLLRMSPGVAVATPNGDGINDEICLVYELLDITAPAPTTIRILNLAGHPVRQVYDGTDPAGRYRRFWDGRDDDGRLVTPGLYLFHALVRVDYRDVSRIGILAVSY